MRSTPTPRPRPMIESLERRTLLNADLPDRFEPNNTEATATDLGTLGSWTETGLTIHHNGWDQDYFSFVAESSGPMTVSIAFSHAQNDLILELYDFTGDVYEIGRSYTDNEQVSADLVAGVTYYVWVDGVYNTTTYDLSIAPGGGGGGGGLSPDRFEPNDFESTATDVGTLGSWTETGLTIHDDGFDEDYFSFVAGTGGPTTVSLAFSAAEGDLQVDLYDTNFDVLEYGVPVPGGRVIVADLVAGTRYYTSVYSFTDEATYDLSIAPGGGLLPDRFEPNNSESTAVDLGTLGTASEAGLTIHDDGLDNDYFSFVAGTGGPTTVSIAFSAAEGNLGFDLYDDNFDVFEFGANVPGGREIVADLVAGTTYYMRIYSFSDEATYDLSIGGGGIGGGGGLLPDRFEPNDFESTAADLGTLGSRTEAGLTVHESFDDDYFSFVAAASGPATVGITFSHAQGDLDLRLYDDNLNVFELGTSSDDNEQVTADLVAGETYYVAVAGLGDTNTYDLSIAAGGDGGGGGLLPDRFEENDSSTNATNLGTLGSLSETGLTIDKPNDDDYLGFVAGESGPYTIELSFSHADGDLDLALYEQSGALIDSSLSTTDNESVTATLVAGRIYGVLVTGLGNTNTYDLAIASDPFAPDRFEPNDSGLAPADLGVLGSRAEQGLTLGQGDPRDWYGFTAQHTGLATVTIASPQDTDQTFVAAYGGGDFLGNAFADADGEQLAFDVVAGQEYLLQVRNQQSVPVVYDLSIEVVEGYSPLEPDRFEENDSPSDAADLGTLNSFSEIGLTVEQPGDDDYYDFVAGRSGTFTVDLGFSHADGDLELELYDDSGTLIDSSQSSTDDERVTAMLVEGRTYSVLVTGDGDTNTYDLAITSAPLAPDRFDPNDDYGARTDLGVIGSRVERGLTLSSGDPRDWFRFTAEHTGQATVTIASPQDTDQTLVTAYNGSINTLGSAFADADGEQVTFDVLGGQEYLLQVRNQQFVPVAYDLSIEVVEDDSLPQPDRFEPNDSLNNPADLGTLASRTEAGLTLDRRNDVDWFSFTAATSGTATVDISYLVDGDVTNLDVPWLAIRDSDFNTLGLSNAPDPAGQQVAFAATAGETYLINAFYLLDGDPIRYDLNVDVAPSAPRVTASAFEFEEARRVTFDFDLDVSVSLDAGDLLLTDAATGAAFSATAVTWDAASNHATFDLPALPDGDYAASIPAGSVDNGGVPNDAGPTLGFFVLAGDANRDRSVDVLDFQIWRDHFGQSPALFSEGDFNYDGTVDVLDFQLWRDAFGRSLPDAGSAILPAGGSLFGDAPVAAGDDGDDVLV